MRWQTRGPGDATAVVLAHPPGLGPAKIRDPRIPLRAIKVGKGGAYLKAAGSKARRD